MKPIVRPNSRSAGRRRGLTLVEMLVTLAVLLIIMTILVQVFQSATGALSAAQAVQELDNELKLLDSTIRNDLNGATAKFTPPLDPALNLGYFEYGENEFADVQGEDSDDYIRFTAKAPPGQPFTGRMWISPAAGSAFYNWNAQPVTVTSEFAEIIYFLRNGNLYRRVLLVAPELQSAIAPTVNNVPYPPSNDLTGFFPLALDPSGKTQVSWQGVNDLSARPAATGPASAANQASQTVVLNSLGDLTNRENRFAYSRFANDFVTITVANGGISYTPGPDGIPDDLNGDNVPDYYPTLYPGVFNPSNPNLTGGATWMLDFETPFNNGTPGYRTTNILGFPFIFPGAYSKAQQLTTGDQCGWIHSPAPYAIYPQTNGSDNVLTFDGGDAIDYLQNLNHNPIDLGDNLPTLTNIGAIATKGVTGDTLKQTWWGFPTWRETLSVNWTDPTVQVNVGPVLLSSASASPQQPTGLVPLDPTSEVSAGLVNAQDPAKGGRALLPAMTPLWRNPAQLYYDGAGDPNNNGTNTFFTASSTLWSSLSWEDDLIMTGVRSFDIKAYDNALGGFGDLGWADDLRLYVPYSNTNGFVNPGKVPPGIASTPLLTLWPPLQAVQNLSVGGTFYSTINQTLAHEGRIPPLVEDNRLDAQFPNPTYSGPTTFTPQYSAYPNYSSNVGDDNNGVVRLRRVWDSWSTEYVRAPATGVNAGYPIGPPFTPPVYPSYPAPYPAPLRGIQIQIRVVDPSNQRIKSLTIRQDFTDKL